MKTKSVDKPVEMNTFAEWKAKDRMVRKGEKGHRDPKDGVVKFTLLQTRDLPRRDTMGNLWDDLGHECTDYDGDGY